jgi:integrase
MSCCRQRRSGLALSYRRWDELLDDERSLAPFVSRFPIKAWPPDDSHGDVPAADVPEGYSALARRSVSFTKRKRVTAPAVSIQPEQAQAIIDVAESKRDRPLLMVLWQTGARVSEALAVTGGDIEPDALWLRNLKQRTDRRGKRPVPLPAGSTLTAELALY